MDYQGSAAGFMARLDAKLDASPRSESVEAPKRAPEPSFFRRTMAPQGGVAGMLLARSCLRGKSTMGDDVALLLDEVLTARPGVGRDYAMARLAAYLGEIDHALRAAREAGLKFDFAPLDEVATIERLASGGR